MKPKIIVPLTSLGLLVAIIAVLGGIKFLQIRALIASSAYGEPATAVSAAEVRLTEWEQVIPAAGSVYAWQGILVATEVAGTVTDISFQAGASVEAGDLLVQLEDSVERANLARAKAELELAQKNAIRSRELRARNSISQAELDAAEANISTAEANVAAHRSQLEKKQIRAPFAGRLGIRQISLGQYLSPGSPIVDLRAIDPVFVEFSLPQAQLPNLEIGLKVRLPEWGEDNPEGEITAINSQVDPITRNIRVQATFSNEDFRLRPGMFVKTEVILPEIREVRIIPQTAVVYNAYGNSVYIVENGDAGQLIARQAFVRLGERQGDFVEVIDGLDPGVRIVRAGAFKLRNNAPIRLEDTGVLEASEHPRPANR